MHEKFLLLLFNFSFLDETLFPGKTRCRFVCLSLIRVNRCVLFECNFEIDIEMGCTRYYFTFEIVIHLFIITHFYLDESNYEINLATTNDVAVEKCGVLEKL